MTAATKKPRVRIEIEGWCGIYLEDISQSHDYSILLGTTHINEVSFHVNAVRVKSGWYDGLDTDGQSLLDDYYHSYEGPWQTIKIGRRRGEYIVLIHPHGD